MNVLSERERERENLESLHAFVYATNDCCECDPSPATGQERYIVGTSLIEEPCLEASESPAWLEVQHRTSQGQVSIWPLVGS